MSPKPPQASPKGDPTGQSVDDPREKAVNAEETMEEKGPSWLKRLWNKTELDVHSLQMMAKGGLPPAMFLAMYQSDAVASYYGTSGYLVALVAILSFTILPRAKFIEKLVVNIASLCVACALVTLALWTSVQARLHTTTSNSSSIYNSSASTVCGIWLLMLIYVTQSLRAKFRIHTLTSVIVSILILVSMSVGPQFSTVTQVKQFIKTMLTSFLTGFALSAGVSLFVFPYSCRQVVFKDISAYLAALDGAVKAQGKYFESLEQADMLSRVSTEHGGNKGSSPEAAKMKQAAATVAAIHGKLHGDLPYAKQETAYGWLEPHDLKEMARLLRAVMLPLVGLSSLGDIFQRTAEVYGFRADSEHEPSKPPSETEKQRLISDWNTIMTITHDLFQSILADMSDGFSHVSIVLKLEKRPQGRKKAMQPSAAYPDVEAETVTLPGNPGFADHVDRRSKAFYGRKGETLRHWCARKGIELAPDFFEHPKTAEMSLPNRARESLHGGQDQRQRQLYFILYIEYLLFSASRAVVELVQFADTTAKKSDQKRLIDPGFRRIKKWMKAGLNGHDSSQDDYDTLGDLSGSNKRLDLGQAFKSQKDPEHLPPRNAAESLGNKMRLIPRVLRSSESSFGFRVACGTMSIAIVNFLAETQALSIKYRFVWASIMVCISMGPTAGQSVFSFILRIGGTVLAMVLSLLIWYIPGQQPAGIIVLLWLSVSMGHYILLKKPRFTIIGLISMITSTMIVGYELEGEKLGHAQVQADGQIYLPVYLLAPYRLAIVAVGLTVAFFWTVFPYATSEHSELRKDVGSALYLLANYYSIVHEAVGARVRGEAHDEQTKGTPGYRLAKARIKVYSKQTLLLSSLKGNSSYVRYEIPVGGRFPKGTYDSIIQRVENIVNYMTLVAYASNTFNEVHEDCDKAWLQDFRRLVASARLTSHEITSMLSLLSGAMQHGHPLPPYLKVPEPYRLSERLQSLDRDILSIRHIAEPGYAAFAVLTVSTRCIIGDLEKLLISVKELVGELDFSFHVVSTTSNSSQEKTADRDKRD